MLRRLIVAAALCLGYAPLPALCESAPAQVSAAQPGVYIAPVRPNALPVPLVNDAVWRPERNLTWQLQFATSPVDTRVDADVYKIDLFDNEASIVAALHKKGKKVVCYMNAGAWEDWRPDAMRFPLAVMGRGYDGWPGERWLDIRKIDLLAPIMLARLDLCRDKGFDGVMLDNVNSYTNRTGFSLTGSDQLHFNVWLANAAHERGLAVGMNNNAEQARQLAPYFDWALAEGCFSEGWCRSLAPFSEQGKAVVVIEYTDSRTKLDGICRQAAMLQFSVLAKKRELDAFRMDCRETRRIASAAPSSPDLVTR